MLNIGSKSKRSTTFTLDLNDALDELIDPGTYAAIVSGVEAIRDDTKILVTFHITDETGETITTLNDSFSKTPSGSRKLKHFLASAQLLPTDPKDNKIVIDPNAWSERPLLSLSQSLITRRAPEGPHRRMRSSLINKRKGLSSFTLDLSSDDLLSHDDLTELLGECPPIVRSTAFILPNYIKSRTYKRFACRRESPSRANQERCASITNTTINYWTSFRRFFCERFR